MDIVEIVTDSNSDTIGFQEQDFIVDEIQIANNSFTDSISISPNFKIDEVMIKQESASDELIKEIVNVHGQSPYEYAVQGGYIGTETEFYNSLSALESDKNYVHNQSVSSATWNINHKLNKFPAVSVIDSANTEIVGEVLYVDLDNLTITFSSDFSGKAILN